MPTLMINPLLLVNCAAEGVGISTACTHGIEHFRMMSQSAKYLLLFASKINVLHFNIYCLFMVISEIQDPWNMNAYVVPCRSV